METEVDRWRQTEDGAGWCDQIRAASLRMILYMTGCEIVCAKGYDSFLTTAVDGS